MMPRHWDAGRSTLVWQGHSRVERPTKRRRGRAFVRVLPSAAPNRFGKAIPDRRRRRTTNAGACYPPHRYRQDMTRHDLDDSSEHLLPRCSCPAANGAPPLSRQALRTGLARPFPNGAPDKTPTQPPFCSKLAVGSTAQVWRSHSRTAPPADHECWRTLARVGRQRRAGLTGPFPNCAAATHDLNDSSERLLSPCSSPAAHDAAPQKSTSAVNGRGC